MGTPDGTLSRACNRSEDQCCSLVAAIFKIIYNLAPGRRMGWVNHWSDT